MKKKTPYVTATGKPSLQQNMKEAERNAAPAKHSLPRKLKLHDSYQITELQKHPVASEHIRPAIHCRLSDYRIQAVQLL